MALKRTEAQNVNSKGIDERSPEEILVLLHEGQVEAVKSIEPAIHSISKAASIAAEAVRSGRKLVYAGAGSSGLMAMADALELPGTYGMPLSQIAILLAGGKGALIDLAGGPEDDINAARRDAEVIEQGDCVIAVTASGSTPYALAVARVAKERGAKLVAIANNPDAKLFEGADVAILLATPPELVSGSTRMGAGSAQKVALNMFSTLMAIELGHVHDGYMVNLKADNIKLRDRASRIVANVAGIDMAEAAQHLDSAAGSVKAAVLLASGAGDASRANDVLEANGHNLRASLRAIGKE